MPTKIKTSLKDGIILAFTETKKRYLSEGDLSFLLRRKKLKRYPTKAKKALYKNWEKQLKDPITNSWKYPFKQYDVTNVAILDQLKSMEKKGMIKKTNKKYRLDKRYLTENTRIYNKISLEWYPVESIIGLSLDKVVSRKDKNKFYKDSFVNILFYGLPYDFIQSLLKGSGIYEEEEKKIIKLVENIERNIREIENITIFKRQEWIEQVRKSMGNPDISENYKFPMITFSRFPVIPMEPFIITKNIKK